MQATSFSSSKTDSNVLKKKIVSNLDRLLPLPEVVIKAQELMHDPHSSFDALAGIIETDQEITLKILRVTNSAFYSLKNEVSSVRQACVMLGFNVIAEIIMAAGTSNLFGKALEAYRMNPIRLWQHSLAVALASRKIANAIRPEMAGEAFLSGLFHDVGKIILDEQIFSRNDAFTEILGNSHHEHFKVEKQILGFDHSDIAYELCKRWKFPKIVNLAIGHHHFLTPVQNNELALILHAADHLTRMNANGNGNGNSNSSETPHPLDDQVRDFLRLNEDDLTDIMTEVADSVNQITNEVFSKS